MIRTEQAGLAWRKSSYSASSANCVEVAFVGAGWRKSSYSADTANCVEIAFADRRVAARDSKHADGSVLSWPAPGWSAFLTKIRPTNRG